MSLNVPLKHGLATTNGVDSVLNTTMDSTVGEGVRIKKQKTETRLMIPRCGVRLATSYSGNNTFRFLFTLEPTERLFGNIVQFLSSIIVM